MAEIRAIGRAAPVPEVIKLARWIQEAAESGEIRALAFCADIGASMRTGFSAPQDRYVLIGMVARMQHIIQTTLDDDSAEPAA